MITIDEKRISLLMEKLHCTRQEALEIIASDKAIDKGAKLFELSPDQKKAAKQMSAAGTRKTVYNFQKRERKADSQKQEILQVLVNAAAGLADSDTLNIQNKEREFTFTISGKKYKVTLSAPRT